MAVRTAIIDPWEEASHDRAIIGIVLGQELCESLPNPEFVLLIADDVQRRWQRHLRALRDRVKGECEKHTTRLRVEAENPEYSILHQFVDEYTHGIEGDGELADDAKAKLWFQHARRLAPSKHPIHDYDTDVGV